MGVLSFEVVEGPGLQEEGSRGVFSSGGSGFKRGGLDPTFRPRHPPSRRNPTVLPTGAVV